MLTSTRTRRGFRAPSRRRPGAAPSLPLLSGSADMAGLYELARRLQEAQLW